MESARLLRGREPPLPETDPAGSFLGGELKGKARTRPGRLRLLPVAALSAVY
jgi:hypothetical protein